MNHHFMPDTYCTRILFQTREYNMPIWNGLVIKLISFIFYSKVWHTPFFCINSNWRIKSPFFTKKYVLAILLLMAVSPILSAAPVPLLPTPPPVQATAYILQDFHSGHILMAKDVDKRIEPASLTKLMTAYLVFEALRSGKIKLTEKVRISEKAWRMIGSKMYIEVDTEVPVEDLVRGMIVQSGNDASVALAEYVASSEETFVDLMNQRAKLLGLNHTHYTNSTGLPDPEHYTNVNDLMIMAKALIRDFPDYYHWYSEREYTYNNITQRNRNLLLWQDKSVDGLKTGYTEAAGYCLIASAKRDNMRLLSIVVGTEGKKQRASESKKMLDYGFRFFETHSLYQANQALGQERVWQGAAQTVEIGLAEPLYITIPRGQYNNLQAKLHIEQKLIAPISVGTRYGSLQIHLGDKLIVERPLLALQNVETGNLWKQMVDYIWLQFN